MAIEMTIANIFKINFLVLFIIHLCRYFTTKNRKRKILKICIIFKSVVLYYLSVGMTWANNLGNPKKIIKNI